MFAQPRLQQPTILHPGLESRTRAGTQKIQIRPRPMADLFHRWSYSKRGRQCPPSKRCSMPASANPSYWTESMIRWKSTGEAMESPTRHTCLDFVIRCWFEIICLDRGFIPRARSKTGEPPEMETT